MKAVELGGYDGLDGLRVVAVPRPNVAAHECLIEVKATGINFAELELTRGRYRIGKEPPFIMGFEAAGVVREIGKKVKNLRIGDRVTSVVSSGGYAEYATAPAEMVIPIPDGVGFAEATTIPIQGLTAHLLLTQVASPSDRERADTGGCWRCGYLPCAVGKDRWCSKSHRAGGFGGQAAFCRVTAGRCCR